MLHICNKGDGLHMYYMCRTILHGMCLILLYWMSLYVFLNTDFNLDSLFLYEASKHNLDWVVVYFKTISLQYQLSIVCNCLL